MNAVWNSYGQLCGCPEIFKKSCKFFCRELDIRVPENMRRNLEAQNSLRSPFEGIIIDDVRHIVTMRIADKQFGAVTLEHTFLFGEK